MDDDGFLHSVSQVSAVRVRVHFLLYSWLLMYDTFCRYLKEFRVEQCPQFIQHKCTQHKPFTCFHWHFMNQRRRRPIRDPKSKTFNYSPDMYCTKYDETTGICADGDDCTGKKANSRTAFPYSSSRQCYTSLDASSHYCTPLRSVPSLTLAVSAGRLASTAKSTTSATGLNGYAHTAPMSVGGVVHVVPLVISSRSPPHTEAGALRKREWPKQSCRLNLLDEILVNINGCWGPAIISRERGASAALSDMARVTAGSASFASPVWGHSRFWLLLERPLAGVTRRGVGSYVQWRVHVRREREASVLVVLLIHFVFDFSAIRSLLRSSAQSADYLAGGDSMARQSAYSYRLR
ncbi:RING finger protein unkempt-like [Tropilaelaps mercedesae]|uniref:RING finger protein unkempt-like n=1 Tax=Tropilaelaps mercedesae TaxID=418985 RepID=A0A1V9X129_9ACAR|nr:RING finger protein unkempt-like [Tropilaelaps mercedesae]